MLKTSMKLLPALVLGGLYGTASASGFQLLEQNASGLGNAYAGSAAVAEDASTIYFNPAGMTKLQDREVSVGLNAIRPSYKFTNNGTTNPAAFGGGAATGGNGGDAGDWGYVPNGYMSWALSKDLYVGVGIGAPFGLKTEYDRNWVGRYQSIKFDIKTLNINPSVAYRLNDKVSVGFGLNWQKFDAEYVRQGAPGALVTLNAKDSAWGWNAGALFQLSPATRLGVSYRSDIKYKLEGDIATAIPGGAGNVTADLKTPDTFILSLTHALNDRWDLLGDLSWTGWGKIPKLDIVRTSGAVAQTLDTDFRNTWRAALGATYKYSDAWKLKFGVAYDQSPVKDAERLTSLPDNNRIWLSVGAQFAPSKTSRLDVGYAHLFVKDSQINNNQNPVQGVVKGNYEADANILGVQYSMSF